MRFIRREEWEFETMAVLSLLFLAIGAILRFGISDRVEGVDLGVVGVVGFLASFVRPTRKSIHERVQSPDGDHVVEERRTTV